MRTATKSVDLMEVIVNVSVVLIMASAFIIR